MTVSADTGLDLVTGAFSYSGSRIAERLLDSGRGVRTFTFHPDRAHRLQAQVQTLPYRFDVRSLKGIQSAELRANDLLRTSGKNTEWSVDANQYPRRQNERRKRQTEQHQ